MTLLLLVVGALFLSFFMIVFRGAPYVPTMKSAVEKVFDLYKPVDGEVFVDIGSGDGRLLLSAAKQGIQAVGIELNPFLVLVSKWRLRRYKHAKVVWGDAHRWHFPDNTTLVFVFTARPFVKGLDAQLQQEANRLSTDLYLITYGDRMPDREPLRTADALSLYVYEKA